MKILVDADGSNRVHEIVRIAGQYKVKVALFCDVSRELYSKHADIIYCDTHRDSADITLFNQCRKGDIVVTRDIGLAGIVLAKGARVLHGSGRIIDDRSIELDLTYRAMKQKIRRNTKHYSQSRKVTFGYENNRDFDFCQNLARMIREAQDEEPEDRTEAHAG